MAAVPVIGVVDDGLWCFLWLLRRMGGGCVVAINSAIDWFSRFLDAQIIQQQNRMSTSCCLDFRMNREHK